MLSLKQAIGQILEDGHEITIYDEEGNTMIEWSKDLNQILEMIDSTYLCFCSVQGQEDGDDYDGGGTFIINRGVAIDFSDTLEHYFTD